MGRILAIGTATLDIISTVGAYPAEDSKGRASHQRYGRGGNATNTLLVLTQLGHTCAWGGVLSRDAQSKPILEELARYHIDISLCRFEAHGRTPTSIIILNQENGTRTIIHYRDLAEFSFGDFIKGHFHDYTWLHFEARAVTETVRMLNWSRAHYPDLPISIEVERARQDIEKLFPHATLLLFSQTFAQQWGSPDAPSFLRQIRPLAPQADLFCCWGAQGAYALTRDNKEGYSPAFPPAQVVDTLGAGDTFNAGIIHSYINGETTDRALSHACQLAGKKCGIIGLNLCLDASAHRDQ